MRFFIADPSLYDEGGHNYDYASEVARAIKSRHAEPVLLTHRRFHVGTGAETAYVPIFTQGLRDGEAFATRVIASLDARVRRYLLPQAAAFEPLFERGHTLVRDLSRALPRLASTASDHWFFPTITWADAVLIAETAAWEGHTDIVVRFDPPTAQAHRERLRQAIALQRPQHFRVWADTPELATAYASIIDREVFLIRMPFPPLKRDRPPKPKTVAFLGESRLDKGFDLLPDLVDFADQIDPSILFTVQTLADPNRDPAAGDAMARLRERPRHNLQLCNGAIPSASYVDILLHSAAVLCLHDPAQYALRSAGAITQAISAGIPVIMLSGESAPLAMILRNNCLDLASLCDRRPESVFEALQAAFRTSTDLNYKRRHLDCVDDWAAPWF